MSVKSKTCEKLNQVYEQHGLQMALEVAQTVLKKKKPDNVEFRTDMYGQLCETVLEILIKDYAARNKLDCCYSKSLILKDLDNRDSDFLTEVDFLLCTKHCIYVFECKSYSGEKQLVGDGTIVRANGNDCDVYSQNALHLSVVRKIFDKFSKTPDYQMVLFEFANGSLVDTREKSKRVELPCCNADNIYQYLAAREKGKVCWDIAYLKKALSVLERNSAVLHQKHLSYVKTLHGGN